MSGSSHLSLDNAFNLATICRLLYGGSKRIPGLKEKLEPLDQFARRVAMRTEGADEPPPNHHLHRLLRFSWLQTVRRWAHEHGNAAGVANYNAAFFAIVQRSAVAAMAEVGNESFSVPDDDPFSARWASSLQSAEETIAGDGVVEGAFDPAIAQGLRTGVEQLYGSPVSDWPEDCMSAFDAGIPTGGAAAENLASVFVAFVAENIKGDRFPQAQRAFAIWANRATREKVEGVEAALNTAVAGLAATGDLRTLIDAEFEHVATEILAVRRIIVRAMSEFEQVFTRVHEEMGAMRKDMRMAHPDIELQQFVRFGAGHIDGGDVDSLAYRRMFDDFTGRDSLLIDLVTNFLDAGEGTHREATKPFRWTLIHGPAGSGKSRLALELLSRAPERYLFAGFVKRESVDATAVRHWRVPAAALLIVDYASRHGAKTIGEKPLRSFLLALAERATKLQPIRVILLERDSGGEWTRQLTARDSENDPVRAACYPRRDTFIELEPLAGGDAAHIVRSRAKRIPAENRRAVDGDWDAFWDAQSDDALLAVLDSIDQDRRPLFAAVTGQALASGWLAIADASASGQRGPDRDQVFREILERERDRWIEHFSPDLAPRDCEERIDAHVALLSTSTMALGLSRTGYFANIKPDEGLLPSHRGGKPPFLDDNLLDRMTGSRTERNPTTFGVMEPDLIGERLVLDLLDGARDPWYEQRNAAIKSIAWRCHGFESASFVRQCYQDYPSDVRKLGFLIPQPRVADDAVTALLRVLAWDETLAVDAKPHANPALPSEVASLMMPSERILEALEAITQTAPDGADSLSEESRRSAAYCLEQVAATLSKLISPAARYDTLVNRPLERTDVRAPKRLAAGFNRRAGG